MSYLKELGQYLKDQGFPQEKVIETFNRCDEYASPLEYENRAMFDTIVRFDYLHDVPYDKFLDFNVNDLYHTYHLNIIDGNVNIPQDYDKEYDTLEAAVDALTELIHSYDGKSQVDGRVCDENDEDIDYCSSMF